MQGQRTRRLSPAFVVAMIALRRARRHRGRGRDAGGSAREAGTWRLAPGASANFAVMCDSGQKAISGGWSDPGDYSSSYQSLPAGDGAGWLTNIWTPSEAPGMQTGTTYAICLR